MKKQKIVTIGGGTGSYMMLTGLKKYPGIELSAIVNMVDDGGSTGKLRDELGVLPPGDIRQCLVAMSESSKILRELFNYRYSLGFLGGHNFGNLLLSTLEKITGSFDSAIDESVKLLNVKGCVIPVTLEDIQLEATLKNGKKIFGEHKISHLDFGSLEELKLSKKAEISKKAEKAIMEADKIIINPGNLYSSILPNFLIDGMYENLNRTAAKLVYVCNLMVKSPRMQSSGVQDFTFAIEKYMPRKFDFIIYNNGKPAKKLLAKYKKEKDYLIESNGFERTGTKIIGDDLVDKNEYKQKDGDAIQRTLVRHNSDKLAKIIYEL